MSVAASAKQDGGILPFKVAIIAMVPRLARRKFLCAVADNHPFGLQIIQEVLGPYWWVINYLGDIRRATFGTSQRLGIRQVAVHQWLHILRQQC